MIAQKLSINEIIFKLWEDGVRLSIPEMFKYIRNDFGVDEYDFHARASVGRLVTFLLAKELLHMNKEMSFCKVELLKTLQKVDPDVSDHDVRFAMRKLIDEHLVEFDQCRTIKAK